MLIADTFQVTYCTNIHPGESWQTTFKSLESYVVPIKKSICDQEPFGIGLRLSNEASKELGTGNHLEVFKKWLASQNLYVVTINGFPYGNFHGERVKDQVHQPNWTTRERVDYTIRLSQQLAELTLPGGSAGISTSPVSYKHWHTSQEDKERVLIAGAKHLIEVVAYLYDVEKRFKKYIHLDIEPEPDGMLENTKDVLLFFKDYLLPLGYEQLKEQWKMNRSDIYRWIHRYLTVCYDVCHFALAYELPEYTFNTLSEAGIKIGKIQVSAALKVLFDKRKEQEIKDALCLFDEDIYLHQVTSLTNDRVITFNDLPEFLKDTHYYEEARVHFHVPIFTEQFGILSSTQGHILKVLEYLVSNPISTCLEIETYTWEVLPADLKYNLTDSIVREIKWLTNRLLQE
ncbi:metabolite traffic protein EboE [Aquimarina sp. ERC-38]|uniref:metabolite traffic protein EboE n=1 Tax=Aquimarina sp. ERC-38 TaxID=2949996 RepID=UPI00224712D1|nr:metabolite traffic protein EboE [Aquimarina sp. ERC-38]UZO80576.1 metabolite traffic protein EboE [Aquimarina sp. ERC-38]